MRKVTKPYVTLRDRTWKGKEWFTSWHSQKNIRRLTEDEAKPFLENGTVKEVISPTYAKDIIRTDNGRMFCNKCNSNKGFYIKKRPFGKAIAIYTCANCSIREIREIK